MATDPYAAPRARVADLPAATAEGEFIPEGQAVAAGIVRRCLDRGWAEPWFSNPLKPDWLVCKLTETGRQGATAP